MHRDIFKDVVDLVCCNYISDLRFLVKEVYQILKNMIYVNCKNFFHMFLI